MEQQHEVKILQEIQNVSWFRLLENNKQLLSKGSFRICSLSEQNIYYINQDDFYFTIQKQIPFISVTFQTHKTYLFPHIENGYNAICVELDDEVITQLDIILSNIATLITKEQFNYQDEALRNSINTHCVYIFETPLLEDNQAVHYIKKGGNFLKSGFMWIGKTAATGVNKAGEYINSKITNQKSVEVSKETKDKFNKIKEVTSTTINVSAGFISAVLSPVVDATNKYVKEVNKKIDNGDNETLKKIKKYGGATIDATADAISGIGKGVCDIGNALGDNTRHIVEKKYGDDVTNTFMGKSDEQAQQQQQQQQEQQAQSAPHPHLE